MFTQGSGSGGLDETPAQLQPQQVPPPLLVRQSIASCKSCQLRCHEKLKPSEISIARFVLLEVTFAIIKMIVQARDTTNTCRQSTKQLLITNALVNFMQIMPHPRVGWGNTGDLTNCVVKCSTPGANSAVKSPLYPQALVGDLTAKYFAIATSNSSECDPMPLTATATKIGKIFSLNVNFPRGGDKF